MGLYQTKDLPDNVDITCGIGGQYEVRPGGSTFFGDIIVCGGGQVAEGGQVVTAGNIYGAKGNGGVSHNNSSSFEQFAAPGGAGFLGGAVFDWNSSSGGLYFAVLGSGGSYLDDGGVRWWAVGGTGYVLVVEF